MGQKKANDMNKGFEQAWNDCRGCKEGCDRDSSLSDVGDDMGKEAKEGDKGFKVRP